MIHTVEVSTVVPAPAEQIWTELVRPDAADAVARRVRLTNPPGLRHETLHSACIGRDLGAGWVLLLAVLPVARVHMAVAARVAAERIELSGSSWATPSWRHERLLESRGRTTVLRDTVSFEVDRRVAWLPGSSALLVRLIHQALRLRHRRLVARIGGTDAAVRHAPAVEVLSLGCYLVRDQASGALLAEPRRESTGPGRRSVRGTQEGRLERVRIGRLPLSRGSSRRNVDSPGTADRIGQVRRRD